MNIEDITIGDIIGAYTKKEDRLLDMYVFEVAGSTSSYLGKTLVNYVTVVPGSLAKYCTDGKGVRKWEVVKGEYSFNVEYCHNMFLSVLSEYNKLHLI